MLVCFVFKLISYGFDWSTINDSTNVIWFNHEAEYLNLEYIWVYTTNLIIIFQNIFKYVFQDNIFLCK